MTSGYFQLPAVTGQRTNQIHEPQEPETTTGNLKETQPSTEAIEDATYRGNFLLFGGHAQKKNRELIYPKKHVERLETPMASFIPKHKVAIIYEYSRDTLKQRGKSCCFDKYEPTEGPLDVGSLYRHLKNSGYKSGYVNSNREEQCSQNKSSRFQRVIYVTNIDDWSVPALILAAAYNNAKLLGAFIPRFLQSESSYKINMPAILGRPATVFTFEFQLSFHALRIWRDTPNTDRRWGGNSSLCRRSRNMRSLSKRGKVWLYEAKAACLMFGPKSDVWDAYVLVDDFYEKGSEDNISGFCISDEEMPFNDFPTRGHRDPTKTLDTPQEYFFTVLCHRLAVCSDEQDNILRFLQGKIKQHGQIPLPNPEISSQEAINRLDAMKRSCNAVSEIRSICWDVDASLSFIVQSLESCGKPNICPILQNIEPNSKSYENMVKLCQEIQATLARLHNIRKHLNLLKEKCERFEEEFGLLMKVNSDNAVFFQKLTLFFSAPGLSANLVQSGVVSMKPRWLPFIFFAVIFWVLPRLFARMAAYGTDVFQKIRPRLGILGLEQLRLEAVEDGSKTDNGADEDDDDYCDDEQDIQEVRDEREKKDEKNTGKGTQQESSTSCSHNTSPDTCELNQRKSKGIATFAEHHTTNEELPAPATHSSAAQRKGIFDVVSGLTGDVSLFSIRKVLTNNQYGPHGDIEMGQVHRDTTDQSNSSSWHGHTSGH